MAATLILATGARVAEADEPTRPVAEAIELGPSRCLEKKALARHVTMWLRKDAIDRRIAIEVADAADGVRFVVKRDAEVLGERTLEVKKVACEEIHAAVGLGVASAIDATVLTSLGLAPPPASLPDPAPPPAISAPVAPAFVAPPRLPPAVWIPPPGLSPGFGPLLPRKVSKEHLAPYFTASVEGMVLIDLLPDVTLGVAPAAELTVVRGFDLRLSALATASATANVVDARGTVVGTADVGLAAGRFDACAALTLLDSLARLRACGGIIAGAVHASGVDLSKNLTAVSPWVAPTVRGDARWSLTRNFGLIIGVDGFFPGLRPELRILDRNGKVEATRPFPLAGVGVTFGPSVTF